MDFLTLFILKGLFARLIQATQPVDQLRSYNVDPSSVTVSGFSSGGAMAMQFHIAFSKDVHGAGIFGGLPYACGNFFGDIECQTCVCHTAPTKALKGILLTQATLGNIDDPNNLKDDKVYIFFGKNDSGLNPLLGPKIQDVYQEFGADISTEFAIEAEHGYPTDFYGSPCGETSSSTQLINNCDYHGAYHALNHLYGNLTRPSPRRIGRSKIKQGVLLEFDQAEFISGSPKASSLDEIGFIFVPSGCTENSSNACKLHIALHGCTQSRSSIGNIFAINTGYLEVAEMNNIIVLFPQASPNAEIGNPNGCWDWWNYLQNNNNINKLGAQMKALHKIMSRVVQRNGASSAQGFTFNRLNIYVATVIFLHVSLKQT